MLTIINLIWYFVLYSHVESVPCGLCISIRLRTPHPTNHIYIAKSTTNNQKCSSTPTVRISIIMLFEQKIASSAELNIELAVPPGWSFAPGDTIVGNVVRRSHLVTPHASLKLSLCGQTKSKTMDQYQDNHHDYKAKWTMFDAQWDQLFRGPLHVPGTDRREDDWTVPFSVEIPTRPSERLVKRHVQAESYLPLDRDSVALQTLPGTFASHADGLYAFPYGSIEYLLEAVLTYGYGGSTITKRATRRIVLCHTSIEPPLTFYDFQRQTNTFTVQSQRLIPGMQDARLSFGQKTQKFFESSKVPKFSCAVDIEVPKKVQLDSELVIPFTIRITSLPNRTSESIRDTLQTIQIHSIKLTLKAITDVRAPGEWSSNHVHSDAVTKTNQSISLLDPPNTPVVVSVPVKGDKGGKDDCGSESIDIGSLLELCLRSDGLHKGSPPFLRTRARFVYPDFVSYLIKHANRLYWDVSLSIAGESKKISSNGPFKVLSEYSRLL